jgi:hypothetical protein
MRGNFAHLNVRMSDALSAYVFVCSRQLCLYSNLMRANAKRGSVVLPVATF